MTKILFLIHDLGQGGAEKVLVNLVNNMDREQFDITVMTLFGGGVNTQFLKPHIRLRTVFGKAFPGNSHVMKLFSPERLHRLFIRERYDIEVSYLEGPSARIISGCPDKTTKLVSWIHCTMRDQKMFASSYRNVREAVCCCEKMDATVFVSGSVRDAFRKVCPDIQNSMVLYNTNDSERILQQASQPVAVPQNRFCWCGMGKLVPVKGFERMIRVQKRLVEDGFDVHLMILGDGPLREKLKFTSSELGVEDHISFLGYQENPYSYLSRCDLFVCSSYSEGFSTAATEALIVGTPVCTVEVSGMKELLGENNEWGIVTENDEEALYQGIKRLLEDPEQHVCYKKKAVERGRAFGTEKTVKAVEKMLLNL